MKHFIEKLEKEKTVLTKIIVLVLLYFGINTYLSFAADTYITFDTGFGASATDMLHRNGRPVIALIYKLHSLTGLSDISFYYISSALALVFLGVAIWIYQKILSKHNLSENTGIILSFVSIANIFIIEYFMFIEKCGFMLAILFNITGIYFIENFFNTRKLKYLIAATCFVILAIFTYPGTIALFVILSIPFALKYANHFSIYILNMLSIGMVYVIPVILDMIAFRTIFKSSRIQEELHLGVGLRTIISGILTYGQTTFHILPDYLFLGITLILFAVGIVAALMSGKKFLGILNVLAIVGASCILSTATILQGSGWWATRIVYPIASMAGALAVNLFVNHPDYRIQSAETTVNHPDHRMQSAETTVNYPNHRTQIAKSIVIFAIGILLVCQYFSFNKIYIDKYKLNALDEYRYDTIAQAIEDYQEETGNVVTKIAFYSDAAKTFPPYPDLFCQGELIVSAFYTDWSDIYAMNYYLNSSYEKVEPSAEYTEYFTGKNWTRFSQEQMIFDGDTLHLCVY